MSLAPVPVGNVGQGKLTTLPGWKFSIDDFNMDVLTMQVAGSLIDVLAFCPNKYSSLSGFLQSGVISLAGLQVTGYQGVAGMNCSDRDIVPGEGLSAIASLTFKGFLNGTARNPVAQLTWLVGNYSVTFDAITLNFAGPVQAQLTLKAGNTGSYQCQIGKAGNPYGSSGVPTSFESQIVFPNGNELQLLIVAASQDWVCIKHDKQEAGSYTEETQVWVRNYVQA